MRRTSFHLPKKCSFLSWWKECSRKDEVWAGENPEAVVQGIPKKMEDLGVTEIDKLFNKSISPCQARPIDKAVGYSAKGGLLDEPAGDT